MNALIDRATAGHKSQGRAGWSSPILIAVAQAVLSALLLLLVSNWNCFYEEDQIAKTAQIMSLAENSNWLHFHSVTDYYSKDLFSAYYLTATAFWQLSHLAAPKALTVMSMLCGVIFFTVTPAFLRRAFQLPEWLSWLVLISAPILVITFGYGNEAAFAITLTLLAAFALTFNSIGARILAAVFYVLAAYSRSDYLFLWPALSFLAFVQNPDGTVNWKQSGKNLLPFTASCAVLGLGYLALVLRQFPRPEFGEPHTNPALIPAFFIYSVNPITAVFAVMGGAAALNRARANYLLLGSVFIQFIPYITHFSSPKYTVPSATAIAVFGMAGMLPWLRRAPWALAILLVVPWLFAITPYGVFGPARAPFWYVPTDDGPLPTGGYLSFYTRVKQGFYQKRYDQDYEQITEAMRRIEGRPGTAELVGHFNPQTLRLWEARHGRWDLRADYSEFWKPEFGGPADNRAELLIKSSYLYRLKQMPGVRTPLEESCNEGRVIAIAGDADDPFPEVIQSGRTVPENADRELGQRILFASAYFHSNQILRRDSWLKDFSGVSWIPRQRFDQGGFESIKPLYLDTHWVCLGGNVPDAVYYSARFPLIYNQSRTDTVIMKPGE